MANLAVTLDWCYPALDSTQRDWIVAKIRAYADWYLANAAPPDVFHDDMTNVWNSVALAGLALKGTSAERGRRVARRGRHAMEERHPAGARRYAGDWWHEGFVVRAGGHPDSIAWYATAWRSATDEDLTPGATNGHYSKGISASMRTPCAPMATTSTSATRPTTNSR